MVKRVLILIGVALGVGLVIGNVSGYALKHLNYLVSIWVCGMTRLM